MTTTAENSLRSRIVAVVSHLLCGLALLPVLVYAVGQAVVGPYQGTSGLASFLGSIYRDLASFELGAWIFVAAPSMIVGVWYGALKVQRHLLHNESTDSS